MYFQHKDGDILASYVSYVSLPEGMGNDKRAQNGWLEVIKILFGGMKSYPLFCGVNDIPL